MQKINITCLGGCGRIGSNMFLFKDDKTSFYIDCGISFANLELLNINFEVPNPEFFEQSENLIITHGHEDHIGAIPFVFKKPKMNIWCTHFTKQLLGRKLGDCSQKFIALYNESKALELGDFTIHFIPVNHSIPETHGLLIQHKEVLIDFLYISDFKIGLENLSPDWFSKCDNIFRAKAKKVFMLDSTNIRRAPVKTNLEEQILPGLEELLNLPQKRIFLTFFSSNVERLENLISLAYHSGRKVFLHGRSIKQYFQSALNSGFLDQPLEHVTEDLSILAESQSLILCTGSQGEARSSLNRISKDEDKSFHLSSKTDIVVFSSMSIPGNEERIQNLKNRISEKNIFIYDNRNSNIHVSGHASRDDLKQIYNHFEPDFIMPIHGESQFLVEHRMFANEILPKAKTVTVLTGSKIIAYNDGLKEKPVDSEYLPKLFGPNQQRIEDDILIEKKKVAREGLISIANSKKRGTEILFVALPFDSTKSETLLKDKIKKTLQLKLEKHRIIEKIKKETFSFCGQRPLVLIHE